MEPFDLDNFHEFIANEIRHFSSLLSVIPPSLDPNGMLATRLNSIEQSKIRQDMYDKCVKTAAFFEKTFAKFPEEYKYLMYSLLFPPFDDEKFKTLQTMVKNTRLTKKDVEDEIVKLRGVLQDELVPPKGLNNIKSVVANGYEEINELLKSMGDRVERLKNVAGNKRVVGFFKLAFVYCVLALFARMLTQKLSTAVQYGLPEKPSTTHIATKTVENVAGAALETVKNVADAALETVEDVMKSKPIQVGDILFIGGMGGFDGGAGGGFGTFGGMPVTQVIEDDPAKAKGKDNVQIVEDNVQIVEDEEDGEEEEDDEADAFWQTLDVDNYGTITNRIAANLNVFYSTLPSALGDMALNGKLPDVGKPISGRIKYVTDYLQVKKGIAIFLDWFGNRVTMIPPVFGVYPDTFNQITSEEWDALLCIPGEGECAKSQVAVVRSFYEKNNAGIADFQAARAAQEVWYRQAQIFVTEWAYSVAENPFDYGKGIKELVKKAGIQNALIKSVTYVYKEYIGAESQTLAAADFLYVYIIEQYVSTLILLSMSYVFQRWLVKDEELKKLMQSTDWVLKMWREVNIVAAMLQITAWNFVVRSAGFVVKNGFVTAVGVVGRLFTRDNTGQLVKREQSGTDYDKFTPRKNTKLNDRQMNMCACYYFIVKTLVRKAFIDTDLIVEGKTHIPNMFSIFRVALNATRDIFSRASDSTPRKQKAEATGPALRF